MKTAKATQVAKAVKRDADRKASRNKQQDVPRLLLAFSFVYLAACNFNPFWIVQAPIEPVTAVPLDNPSNSTRIDGLANRLDATENAGLTKDGSDPLAKSSQYARTQDHQIYSAKTSSTKTLGKNKSGQSSQGRLRYIVAFVPSNIPFGAPRRIYIQVPVEKIRLIPRANAPPVQRSV